MFWVSGQSTITLNDVRLGDDQLRTSGNVEISRIRYEPETIHFETYVYSECIMIDRVMSSCLTPFDTSQINVSFFRLFEYIFTISFSK